MQTANGSTPQQDSVSPVGLYIFIGSLGLFALGLILYIFFGS